VHDGRGVKRYAGRRVRRLTLFVSVAAMAFTSFAVSVQAATFEFPSSSSTVVSSGASPPNAFGYFWSQARGDKVEQAFVGPPIIDHALLTVQPTENSLKTGNTLDWTLSINGVDVGTFSVPSGDLDPVVVSRSFAAIAGPSYVVKIRVTNEIPSGGGSHTLASTGSLAQHSLELSKEAPDTRVLSGPPATTTATTATFAFDSPQPSATGFQCSIDHTSFVPCSSPKSYSALAVGPHSFEVGAVDAFGTVDPTPAAAQWTVTAAPTPKAKPRKCKKGFKKVKRHGKSICLKKKHHKKGHKPKHHS
jgi:hypothetical protein